MARLLRGATAAALATLAVADVEHVYPSAEGITVYGACDVINGLTFVKQGYTRGGSPYFKATTSEKYLYYDSDCEGGTAEPNRWIFDYDMPDVTKVMDLDNDLACNYIASMDSTDATNPTSGKWSLFCSSIEEEHFVTLSVGQTPYNGVLAATAVHRALVWEGACAFKSFLNGKLFEEVGKTADGRPFFKSQYREEYIYYDADCDGQGTTFSSRWVLDNGRPSTTATRDLDQDGRCDYHARFDSNSFQPPAFGNWVMFCGAAEGWATVPVTLRETLVPDAKAVNSAQRRGVLPAVVVAFAAACATTLGF